jgi:hypothetical protein
MGDSEERIETWINKRSGMGVTMEWFRLSS